MESFLSLVLLATVSVAATQTFDPGCSFFNGQCVYNVKLGHESQCDAVRAAPDTNGGTTSSTTSGLDGCSCKDIDTLTTNVNALFSSISTLQGNFDKLAQEMNVTQETLGMKESELATLLLDKQSLSAQLLNQQILMNKSQVELANTVSSLNNELDRLRRDLTSTSNKLTNCETVSGTSPSTKPSLYGDFVVNYCGFEDSHFCNYTMETCSRSTEECWHRGSGRQNVYSGPIEDHTFGAPGGHYIYIDPTAHPSYHSTHSDSYTAPARKARITTPEMPPASEYCVRFWYTMIGDDIGTLNVYAQIGGGDGYPIFTKSGQQDKDWHMVEIPLDSEYTSSPFKLVFEGTTRSYYVYSGSSTHKYYDDQGYISIDDVYIYNTSCSVIPACPAGYHKLVQGNITSCYTVHTTPMGWYDAVKTCKTEAPNGHLISVNSKQEQDFIVSVIQNDVAYTAVGSQGFYTSGNDERNEGHFSWTDTGYPYSLSYTDWHIGQPNNVGSAQDCLLLQYKTNDYQWGDVNCIDKHPFICEIHM